MNQLNWSPDTKGLMSKMLNGNCFDISSISRVLFRNMLDGQAFVDAEVMPYPTDILLLFMSGLSKTLL